MFGVLAVAYTNISLYGTYLHVPMTGCQFTGTVYVYIHVLFVCVVTYIESLFIRFIIFIFNQIVVQFKRFVNIIFNNNFFNFHSVFVIRYI